MRIRVEKRLKVGGNSGGVTLGRSVDGETRGKWRADAQHREKNGMTVVYTGELKPALFTGKLIVDD